MCRAAALVLDLPGDVGGPAGGVGIGERHGGAVGGQPPGDRRADATAAAGHERYLACEFGHCVLLQIGAGITGFGRRLLGPACLGELW
jgi:hypothetical protein